MHLLWKHWYCAGLWIGLQLWNAPAGKENINPSLNNSCLLFSKPCVAPYCAITVVSWLHSELEVRGGLCYSIASSSLRPSDWPVCHLATLCSNDQFTHAPVHAQLSLLRSAPGCCQWCNDPASPYRWVLNWWLNKFLEKLIFILS